MKTQSITVHGIEILIINQGKKEFVSIEQVCQELGIDYSLQLGKVKDDSYLNDLLTLIEISQSNGKKKRIYAFPYHDLFGWLMSIDTADVSKESSDKLISYKIECYSAILGKMKGKAMPGFDFNIKTTES